MADIVTAAQAQAWLRESNATAAADSSNLGIIISSASEAIENIVGLCSPQTFTEYYDGGRPTVVVRHVPLISVQSVTEYIGTTVYDLAEQPLGSQTNAWAYTVNQPLNRIERRTFGGAPAFFMPGESNLLVTYTAGRDEVPPTVVNATLALIKHWYESTLPQRTGGSRGWSEENPNPLLIGYAIPNFILEMLQPQRRGPGIA